MKCLPLTSNNWSLFCPLKYTPLKNLVYIRALLKKSICYDSLERFFMQPFHPFYFIVTTWAVSYLLICQNFLRSSLENG